jgi:tetratricopeptide (TPR) repeat protein
VLLKKRQFAEAMPAFREACERKANFALGYFYWGLALYEMGNTQGALGQFNLAHKLDTTLFLPLYYSGLVQQKLGQYKKAQQFFEQVIGLDSSFAPVHNAIGVSHYHLGNESEAIISFQRACKISPDFATAHLNLGDIFLKLEKYETAQMHYRDTLKSSDLSAQERASAYNNLAIIDAKSKAWEKACDNLSQGHAIAPDLTNIQINLGLVLIALREYDLAISHFEQVLKRNSNEPEANFYLGLSLLCLSKRDQALEQLLKAARIIEATNLKGTALHQQLLLWLAYAHLANKNYPEAKQGLDKLISLSQKNNKLLSLAYDALGIGEALQNNHGQAKQYFDKAIATDNNLALSYLHRGQSLENLGNSELASKDYNQALKIDANCLKANKDYITQLLESAQLEEALIQAIKIQELKPNDTESQILLAKAHQKKSTYTEALVILNNVIKNDPKNVEAYTMIGQIYMSQGDFAQADEVFRNASKFDKVDAELFLSWARALAYLGFYELALEKFKEAADMNPYDADIYESWAQALKSLGRFNEASEVYKLASSYL